MKKIGVILLGCCLGVFLSASVATAGPKGECNRILAKEIGQAEKIHNGVDTVASCIDLVGGLSEFISNPNQCLVLLNNGDLFIKPDRGVSRDLCDVLLNICGLGPVLPPGVCPN
ncbi:MAG: hypothetical protein JRE57_04535 [Deltaproteobacteria bacterium]|nr:hypothetical protein [Deltaproteobacteria bacterium]